MLGDHVTLEAGTGCVHTAPGHGQDDYLVGLRYGLEIYNPVDDYGRYREELELFGGMKLDRGQRGGERQSWREVGALLKEGKVTHSYPHCWRCKKPIIFRATEQWFISMETNGLREQVAGRHQRRRSGFPAGAASASSAWSRTAPTGASAASAAGGYRSPSSTAKNAARRWPTARPCTMWPISSKTGGSDIWFEKEAAELLPAGHHLPQPAAMTRFTKETDILDVWFDSGVSHAAVLERRDNLASPADLYLEGRDQHRGWFHSSLLAAVGTRGIAPYKAVLTHGFVVDGNGKKMSKSMGNVIAPEEVIKKFGAEILRLWVAAQDYRDDIRLSQEILQRLSDAYRRIRNTARYILGNLHDFDPAADGVPDGDLLELDRWALSRLEELVNRVERSYEEYEFHVLYHAVHNFCSVDMSAFYLDVLKDRLYTAPSKSLARRSAQTAMYRILDALTRLIAPVLSFTAEEIWRIPPRRAGAERPPGRLSPLRDAPSRRRTGGALRAPAGGALGRLQGPGARPQREENRPLPRRPGADRSPRRRLARPARRLPG